MGRAAFDEAFRRSTAPGWRRPRCGKCARWKNPQRLEPGNYTVVLEPTAAGDLGPADDGGFFGARPRKKGRTFLSKRGGGTLVGEKMFPEYVTLRSDPFDGRQPSSPWTGDLLPAQAPLHGSIKAWWRIFHTTAIGLRRPARNRTQAVAGDAAAEVGAASSGGGGGADSGRHR